jgi:hypothetical protein
MAAPKGAIRHGQYPRSVCYSVAQANAECALGLVVVADENEITYLDRHTVQIREYRHRWGRSFFGRNRRHGLHERQLRARFGARRGDARQDPIDPIFQFGFLRRVLRCRLNEVDFLDNSFTLGGRVGNFDVFGEDAVSFRHTDRREADALKSLH